MKWLEGWLGSVSSVVGAVLITAALLTTSLYAQSSRSCLTADGYNICGGGYPPSPDSVSPLSVTIPVGIIVLLYLGVFVGTWLDLRGKRSMGRLILIVSAILLVPALLLGIGPVIYLRGSGPGATLAASALPFALLALVTAIIACARRDATAAREKAAPEGT